jgi:hypothetical protein
MNIDDLTIREVKELMSFTQNKSCESDSIKIGEKYLIRTVTNYFTGRVISKTDFDLVLEDCAWIPDTGRFKEAVEKGSFKEVEPYKNLVIINKSVIIDMTVIDFDLPRGQKG